MTHNPPTSQQLDAIQARIDAASPGPWTESGIGDYGWGVGSPAEHIVEADDSEQGRANAAFIAHARADVEQLVAEVRRLRAQGAAIEGLERAFTAELDDTNALALVDALIVLRSKLPCTCARSRGLHEKACQRYVPGHDLLSGQSRLAQARAEMRPAVRPAVETGA